MVVFETLEEARKFVLQCNESVEVIEPSELREKLVSDARKLLTTYGHMEIGSQ